jgi:murein DD-endopeptidase MepM/ murein hydrolase activator NlpD
VFLLAPLLALVLGAAAPCFPPPVDGAVVVDPFRPPACTWCPGNRGIEYATVAGSPVRAMVAGEVTFAGDVAGVRYVVVASEDGYRVTYGWLESIGAGVGPGRRVRAGQHLGRAGTRFHLGVRVGDGYVDPASLVGRWRVRPHLVPTDGSPARSGRAAHLDCPLGTRRTTR